MILFCFFLVFLSLFIGRKKDFVKSPSLNIGNSSDVIGDTSFGGGDGGELAASDEQLLRSIEQHILSDECTYGSGFLSR